MDEHFKQTRYSFFFFFADILMLKLNFCHCGFVWTPRDANRMAHQVTRWGLVGNLQRDWVVNVPSRLQDLLSQLVGCLGCVRFFSFVGLFLLMKFAFLTKNQKRYGWYVQHAPAQNFTQYLLIRATKLTHVILHKNKRG